MTCTQLKISVPDFRFFRLFILIKQYPDELLVEF